ncbi:NUDIX hydrolase [Nocardioides solisilvae]|uniref:NUDIX hydrolase n=1 Tax=Nocardioides solisilvae TaxID=1542435 RepID=UPI000D74D782|nr:NUDIX hydrolase [Nocardioides solisilvae]
MRLPLPERLVEHALRYRDGEATPVEPRDAATVVLLRAGDGEPDVYLLRRQATMAFAGGMCVFPGGGVDPRDDDPAVAWAGPTPAEWAERLAVDEDKARALVCAAVRETFEESGVLLAGPSADTLVDDTTGDDWEADRVALEARELHFSDFLVRRGLVLRTDLLGVWSGWLTPEFEPRRYRTWFFVALLPEGQVTRHVGTEASSVRWVAASEAVRRAEAGEIGMMPPTWLTCLALSRYADPAAVLEASRGRRVEMFTPALQQDGEEWTLTTHPDYVDLLADHQRRTR